jgi:hypothetical protein
MHRNQFFNDFLRFSPLINWHGGTQSQSNATAQFTFLSMFVIALVLSSVDLISVSCLH